KRNCSRELSLHTFIQVLKNFINLFLFVYISISLYDDIKVRRRCFIMVKTMIEMDKAADILKLLGNETRLTMLKILDDHDCCVCEFVEIFQRSEERRVGKECGCRMWECA